MTGTLYTDILTDQLGVPLWISTTVFAVLLAVVFGIWYARERTLSIHSIVTTPREAFYWLAVLVTFALGTATGDWTLELTGWGPGVSVLLPLVLIAIVITRLAVRRQPGAVVLARLHPDPAAGREHRRLAGARPQREGARPRHLRHQRHLPRRHPGAPSSTSPFTRADVIEGHQHRDRTAKYHQPRREWPLVGVMTAATIAAGILLNWASAQPHANAAAEGEGPNPAEANVHLTSQQATSHFPAADVAGFRTLVRGMDADLVKGDQARLNTAVDAYEKAGTTTRPSSSRSTGRPGTSSTARTTLFTSVRDSKDPAAEKQAIQALAKTMG